MQAGAGLPPPVLLADTGALVGFREVVGNQAAGED